MKPIIFKKHDINNICILVIIGSLLLIVNCAFARYYTIVFKGHLEHINAKLLIAVLLLISIIMSAFFFFLKKKKALYSLLIFFNIMQICVACWFFYYTDSSFRYLIFELSDYYTISINSNFPHTTKMEQKQKFIYSSSTLVIFAILLFRFVLSLLIWQKKIELKTEKETQKFTSSLNPLITLQHAIGSQICVWFNYIKKSRLFKILCFISYIRGVVRWITLLINYSAALDLHITTITSITIKKILEDSVFFSLYIIGIWSLLFIRFGFFQNSSILKGLALFTFAYSTLAFLTTMYIFIFKLNTQGLHHRLTAYIYLIFPLWVFLNRCLFIAIYLGFI